MRWIAVAVAVVAGIVSGHGQPPSILTMTDLLRTVRIPDVDSGGPFLELSPDGEWVVAQIRTTALEANTYRFELIAWRTQPDGGRVVIAADTTPTTHHRSFVAQWSPDGTQLGYLQREGETQYVQFMSTQQLRGGTALQSHQIEVPGGTRDFRWSPDSRKLALIARIEPTQNTAVGGIQVDVDWPEPRVQDGLWMLDLESKRVTRIADPALNVGEMEWSPDGRSIVLAASRTASWDAYMKQDLYLHDVSANITRELVEQPGWEGTPVWSPDGQWIAFVSGEGKEDWQYSRTVAVVSVSGAHLSYPARDYADRIGHYPYWLGWSGDSSQIFLMVSAQTAHRLFRVSRRGGSIELVTPSDDSSYTGFAFSPASDKMAFARESVTKPRDIFVSPITKFSPIRVSNLNPDLEHRQMPVVETIAWRSTDGRFDVPGILVKPGNYDARKRYPLLVIVPGGPASANLSFDVHSQYPTQVFASSGYAVLIANTRGRNGYGDRYRRTIQSDRDYGPGPSSDILAGVDHLVLTGMADPDRLGILGFSYGAYLAAYTLTVTDRFKAAALSDCTACNIPYAAFNGAGDPSVARLRRDLWGFGLPYDAASLHHMVSQSPVHHAKSLKTPSLLEFGELSHAHAQGRMLFHALRSQGVPAEMIVYPRTGHGINEPLLREDSHRRNLDWMDFWVRGMAVKSVERRWLRGKMPG